tara:strand:- start:730 stop:1275 length:546 start_codon:yes stop_codon:yes gene_type:complete
MLEIPSVMFKDRLVNAFMYDTDVMPYRDNHLFIVHSNKQDKNFQIFENFLEEQDNFINSYDIVDTYFGVKIFSIDDKYQEAYDAFKIGKYSAYDLIARGSCFKFGIMEDNRVLHHVFIKSEELKKLKEINLGMKLPKNQELWSIWDTEYDIITPELKDYLKKNSKISSINSNKHFKDELRT